MTFVISNLDQTLLLQALYAYAAPNGLGQIEHSIRDIKGDNVLGLTDEECEEILASEDPDSKEYLIDYCKGKPIKFASLRQSNGDLYAYSTAYDIRNGKYRFLEAMLNTFDLDEIIFAQKSYPSHMIDAFDQEPKRPKQQLIELENVLKNTIRHKANNRTCWIIDKTKVNYVPQFVKDLIS